MKTVRYSLNFLYVLVKLSLGAAETLPDDTYTCMFLIHVYVIINPHPLKKVKASRQRWRVGGWLPPEKIKSRHFEKNY